MYIFQVFKPYSRPVQQEIRGVNIQRGNQSLMHHNWNEILHASGHPSEVKCHSIIKETQSVGWRTCALDSIL